MKAEDLRAKTEDELSKLLLDTRKDQFNQRFQKSQGTLENTAELRKTRRLVAQIKTLLNEKRTGAANDSAPKKAEKPAAPKAEKKPAEKKTTAKKAPAKKKAAAKKDKE